MEKLTPVSLKHRPYFLDCIQWNEDGQLAVCLDVHVHIITPLLTGLSSNEESVKHVGFSLPELKKTAGHNPIDETQLIQTSFMIDEGYRCTNWSPNGLSDAKGCILVVVTTKHRVLLYQSSLKDSLNSDWQLFANITDAVEHNAITHQHKTKINPHHTLYANWSKKIIHHPFISTPCLLALSNKAGDLCIWTLEQEGVKYLSTITPHTSFVNFIQWSSWKKGIDDNTYIAYVATTSTNGTVALTSVTVTINIDENKNASINNIQLSILNQWFNEGSAVTTLIKLFDDFENDSPFIRIALCKGIAIHFISLSLDNDCMDIDKQWSIYCLDNSAIGLCSGDWINDFDFRCYTVEGEGLQFHFSADDTLTLDKEANVLITNKLIQKYKQQWMDEQAKADEDDIIAASDALPYLFGTRDSLSHMYTAIFFAMRPTVDIHYRPESADESNLSFILQKPRGLLMDNIMEDLNLYVNNLNFFFVKPVRGLIRETLDYLIEDDDYAPFEKWLTKLIEYMKPEPVLDGRDLTTSIYCESSTIASRIIFNVDLELKNYRLVMFANEFSDICTEAKHHTLIHFLTYVFCFALQLPDEKFLAFTEQDKMVLLMLSDYALSLWNKSLTGLCLEIYVKLQDKFSELDLYQEIAYSSSPDGPYKPTLREKCPVCDELVRSIGGSTLAQCDAGHFWELCSITRIVLYSPNTRTCSGCGSKSLQPNNDKSLTDIILNHCCRCIYCGGGLLKS